MRAEPLPGGGDPLEHRYSRHLLYCLYVYTTPMKLPDVADQITVWDEDADGDYLEERLRIYDTLYHDHVPALCEADLVEYDQRTDTVDLGPAAEEAEPAVERVFLTEVDELLRAEGTTFDADEKSG